MAANGIDSKYLLTGMAICGQCGGTLHVCSSSHGRQRAYIYACTSYRLRGGTVCTNNLEVPMPVADQAVLSCSPSILLRPGPGDGSIHEQDGKFKAQEVTRG